MKKLRWNFGILLIGFGYKVRKHNFEPTNFSLRWEIGVLILQAGYYLRGNIPQKTWKFAHV